MLGILVLAGVAYFAVHYLEGRSLAHLRIVYNLGEPRVVELLEAELVRPGEPDPVARFSTRLLEGPVVQKVPLRPGTYELHVTVTGASGRSARISRALVVRSPETETVVDLSQELR